MMFIFKLCNRSEKWILSIDAKTVFIFQIKIKLTKFKIQNNLENWYFRKTDRLARIRCKKWKIIFLQFMIYNLKTSTIFWYLYLLQYRYKYIMFVQFRQLVNFHPLNDSRIGKIKTRSMYVYMPIIHLYMVVTLWIQKHKNKQK